MAVDLHLHTTASDGSFSPKKLVDKASEMGYRAIAVTDHDTVSGIQPALNACKNKKLEVIPGIEINTNIKNHEIHILGYFIEYRNELLIKKLNQLKEKRWKRAKKILVKLKEMGVNISWQDILATVEGDSIGRSHIARALISKKYAKSWDEAFAKYIGIDAPAYVSRERLTPGQAIKLIKDVKGLSVLAHPGLINNDKLIKNIINYGIDGLEVYYYEHNKEEVDRYKKIAINHNLIITGGSDGHGPGKKDGMRLGKMKLSYDIVKHLKKKINYGR